jgi:hypothetical protein
MATLPYQQSKVTGTAATFTAASAGGDKVAPSASGIVVVRNGDTNPHTVTVAVPGAEYGQNRPDVPVVIAAGASAFIGPFPADVGDPTDRLVHLTYDAVTAVTVAAVEI